MATPGNRSQSVSDGDTLHQQDIINWLAANGATAHSNIYHLNDHLWKGDFPLSLEAVDD